MPPAPPCMWRRAQRAAPFMSSLLFIFFSLICALEGTFATMGPALHGTLAPERQVQGVWGAGSPPGNVKYVYCYTIFLQNTCIIYFYYICLLNIFTNYLYNIFLLYIFENMEIYSWVLCLVLSLRRAHDRNSA